MNTLEIYQIDKSGQRSVAVKVTVDTDKQAHEVIQDACGVLAEKFVKFTNENHRIPGAPCLRGFAKGKPTYFTISINGQSYTTAKAGFTATIKRADYTVEQICESLIFVFEEMVSIKL